MGSPNSAGNLMSAAALEEDEEEAGEDEASVNEALLAALAPADLVPDGQGVAEALQEVLAAEEAAAEAPADPEDPPEGAAPEADVPAAAADGEGVAMAPWWSGLVEEHLPGLVRRVGERTPVGRLDRVNERSWKASCQSGTHRNCGCWVQLSNPSQEVMAGVNTTSWTGWPWGFPWTSQSTSAWPSSSSALTA